MGFFKKFTRTLGHSIGGFTKSVGKTALGTASGIIGSNLGRVAAGALI